MISKNLQESSTIQNISVNLLSVIIVIIVRNSLFYSITKTGHFPIIANIISVYNFV